MAEPTMPADMSSFDAAAVVAEEALCAALNTMSAPERKGAKIVMQWQKANYLIAGHKRLGRILVKIAKEDS